MIVTRCIRGCWGILLAWGVVAPGALPAQETRSFDTRTGDTLIVRNDFGIVRILAWNQDRMQARVEKSAVGIDIAAEKSGDRIFLQSSFRGGILGSVTMDIQVPSFMNVVIWGANPEIEVSGIAGFVRIQTLNGAIAAENLTSSVSLTTDRGDIWLRSRIQPQGDVRLESVSGNILFEVRENLNFHGWTRAGGRLIWSPGFEQQGGQRELEVGSGGPLLYAGSLHGDVRIHFEPLVAGSETAASGGLPQSSSQKSVPEPGADTGREGREKPPEVPATDPVTQSGAVSIKVQVDWVYLNVSVRDSRDNHSIPDLREEDFLVYEDGALQQVQQYESAEAPFNLLLLLDISGSTESYLSLIKQASIDFTREIKSNDRIAVATFNSSVELIQGFTNDRAEVAAAIRHIRSGGGTAFYDALNACIEDYLRETEGRTAIVVFTDGVDNQLERNSTGSRITFDQLFRKIQEIDPIIYTIFLDTEGRVTATQRAPGGRPGNVEDIIRIILGGGSIPSGPAGSDTYEIAREQLQRIADQTGGRMYTPKRIDDLGGAYSEIADDLRIQYRLAYNSPSRDQSRRWHAISVQIKNRPEALARTRKGYYTRT